MAGSFDLDVQGSLRGLADELHVEAREIPFVTAMAMNYTAEDIKAAAVAEMQRVFDRPTRFTLNALAVRRASKHDLHAEVYFKEGFGSIPAKRYLGPEVSGGGRGGKSFELALRRAGVMTAAEYAVPTSYAPLDGFGNLRGSIITRILSDVQANPDPLSNSTHKTRTRRRKRGRGTYFVVRGGRPAAGIYFRLGLRDMRPILLFVRQPRYSPRFEFYAIAQRIAEGNFGRNFERAVAASDVFAAFRR